MVPINLVLMLTLTSQLIAKEFWMPENKNSVFFTYDINYLFVTFFVCEFLAIEGFLSGIFYLEISQRRSKK